MMKKTYRFSADELLTNGFAAHVMAWSKAMGASQDTQTVLARLAKKVSEATLEGHVCLDLNDYHDDTALADVRNALIDSGVVGTPAAPDSKPLILDDQNHLYLHRYYDYEKRLALRLHTLQKTRAHVDPARIRFRLDALFGMPEENGRFDKPRIAAALAMQRDLLVISGGPGTGKTTTIVNLLACLLEENPACRIALTAPTGKAAARMLETIHERASDLPVTIQEGLPHESFTLHRLLGVTSENRFRHHLDNPLPMDVVIVDEASMLDIALATHLFEAIPEHARIILLGDKDQLSAVEAGAVFAELSADPTLTEACIDNLHLATGLPRKRIAPPVLQRRSGLQDSVVWFTENFRFAKDSRIGRLAQHIRQGETDASLALLAQASDDTLIWLTDADPTPSASVMKHMQDAYADYLDTLLAHPTNPAAIFAAFDRFRILCALREGPRGVLAINRQLDRHFHQHLGETGYGSEHWYPGRPIIISRNDYLLNLFNGDIGITLWEATEEGQRLAVYFPDKANGFRAVPLARLPEHETAFAMTVHKSQGSEFDAVFLMMPETVNRITTRELLYTAITRARKQVNLCASESVLRDTIASPTQRHSGLHRQLQREIQREARNG